MPSDTLHCRHCYLSSGFRRHMFLLSAKKLSTKHFIFQSSGASRDGRWNERSLVCIARLYSYALTFNPLPFAPPLFPINRKTLFFISKILSTSGYYGNIYSFTVKNFACIHIFRGKVFFSLAMAISRFITSLCDFLFGLFYLLPYYYYYYINCINFIRST